MLFQSPTGASPLDVPEELVEFYKQHGFKPLEDKAKVSKPRQRKTTKKE